MFYNVPFGHPLIEFKKEGGGEGVSSQKPMQSRLKMSVKNEYNASYFLNLY